MIALYYYFIGGAGSLSSSQVLTASVVAALVMIVLGFFFAAVSGNLVGMIGSSNNPVSGLTLCTLVIAALLMVALGVSGTGGVAAVLGVAAVVCVSSAVAGEMLQDLKVGHILGGTPSKMQIGDLFGIVVASLVLFFPLAVLDKAYHFGSSALPAPQAGLMAMLSKGIVGGDMAWPLVIVGILLGIAMIMIEVKSVMLFAVGMYLPLGTTFAIFVGGVIRWVTDKLRDRRGFNDAQKARVDNAGVLTASGLIAGEALCGLVIAGLVGSGKDVTLVNWTPSFVVALVALAVLIIVMVHVPLANAGQPGRAGAADGDYVRFVDHGGTEEHEATGSPSCRSAVLRGLVFMSISENIAEVRERIAAAARRAGRSPNDVALMAVSKTFPPERIREAYDAGLRLFGENRVQEFAGKAGRRWRICARPSGT